MPFGIKQSMQSSNIHEPCYAVFSLSDARVPIRHCLRFHETKVKYTAIKAELEGFVNFDQEIL